MPLFPGFRELGDMLLSRFKWGASFYKVNGELLDKYMDCQTSTEVISVQQEYLASLEREKQQHKPGKQLVLCGQRVEGSSMFCVHRG